LSALEGIEVTDTSSLFPNEVNEPALPSGLFYAPSFLSTEDQRRLFEEIDANEWSLELKRRVQHYGYRYDYKARRIDPSMHLGPLPPFAIGIAARLQTVTSFTQLPDQLIVNEYLPGQGISAHVDCKTCFNNRVAIASLGWPYEMEFQHTHSQTNTKLLLGVGSLLVLADEARYRWTHQIRARHQDRGVPRQRRLSLTFRKVLLS
jgi:alkylated DNA repair dioxygenase AlkB